MCAARRSAPWPQLVALSLIGIAVASCSADSGRFNEGFGSPSSSSSSRGDVTGSIPQTAPPASHVDSRPLPSLASADNGASGGGRGMGPYQPGGEVTGSVAPPPAAAGLDLGRRNRGHGPPWANRRRHCPRARRAGCHAAGSQSHRQRRFGLSRRAPCHSALSPGDRGRDAAARADRLVSAGGHSALRSAARRLGCAFRFACRGARRNAQQHCAALRQAGYGHCPRQ